MEWNRKYHQGGLAALLDQRQGGNRALLSYEALEAVQRTLHQYQPQQLFAPHEYEGEGRFWTIASLSRLLERDYGVIASLLRSDSPVSYAGEYYRLEDAILLPRPERPGGPRLLIGGNGPQRTLPLVARYAQEWNGVFIPASRYAELSQRLDELIAQEAREAKDVRRSIMTNVLFGRDDAEVAQKVGTRNRAELQARGILVGTKGALQEQLGTLAEAGVQRALLQWLDLDDIDGLEAFAAALL